LFDTNDIYSTGYPVASDPPESPGAQSLSLRSLQGQGGDFDPLGIAPRPNAASASSQPLLIELQNGRYVRVNSPAIDGEALPLKPDSSRAPTTSARESATVLLIFRDGHTEKVRDYTIANGILYAHGDFYTDGYWNKKIDLSTLDLPQTQQANAKRNVNFILPSYPNEVITRF
jgi:hypothetical protein